MKWVVLGDIGRSDYYHLGDEAMTEVAAEMLSARGATSVTLVASDAATATATHGYDAVSRAPFEWDSGRESWEDLLSQITDFLQRDDFSGSVLAGWAHGIRDADAVLIAGGGNLNSQYPHLLYERVAFARVAQHFGRPLFITSQTVGPMLRERDRELVAELLELAVVFGAREGYTAALLRGIAANPERVVHTYDDAVLLRARPEDRGYLEANGIEGPVVIGSFTEDAGASGLSNREYTELLARLLDDVAEDLGVDVVLVPHAGTFAGQAAVRDQLLNNQIAALSSRARALPTPTARENVAITEAAVCSISTRYHPVVFAAQAEIATVGISLSAYSSVRMRGALGNVGQQEFVVPVVQWDRVRESVRAAVEAVALRESNTHRAIEYQSRWWDAIYLAAQGPNEINIPDLEVPRHPDVVGDWTVAVEAVTPTFELLGMTEQLLHWSQEELTDWRARAHRAEGRKVARLTDSVAKVVRKFK